MSKEQYNQKRRSAHDAVSEVRDGDVIRLCGHDGQLETLGVDLAAREPTPAPPPPIGTGRELFAMMRHHVDEAERGGSAILSAMESELR